MFSLRPYQRTLIDTTREAVRASGSAIMQAPTGAGKSATMADMIARAHQRGRSAVFVVHRHELMAQASKAFHAQGIPHGLIASGTSRSRHRVQVATIQTLIRRLRHYTPPDLLVIDEAHHASAASYRRLIEAWPDAYRIGLTATPARTDGAGLDDLFASLVCGPSTRELIDAGWLADYVLFAPSTPDLSGVHVRAGDYRRDEAAEAVDRPSITGDAVAHYQRHTPGKRALAFCVSRDHARHVVERFRAAGEPAEYLGGDTPAGERAATLERFRQGECRVLVSVDLLIEGLDVPAAEVAIMLRPTQSLVVFLQQIGRVLRPDPGKERAVILDHVGNSLRHGLPDDEREWTLEGSRRRGRRTAEQLPAIRRCGACHAVFRPRPVCPQCGASCAPVGRQPDEAPGELAQVDREALRRTRRREEGKAAGEEGLAGLVRLGVERGYDKPAAWAGIRWAARTGRARGECIAEAARALREG